jgi:murein DD-endopeptidase MepM/ murein hydrolase activator NlpD
MLHGLAKAVLVATLAGVTVGGVVLPAQAADRDGVCDAGELCLYYNSDQEGSVSDFRTAISRYGESLPGCYVFTGAGAGKGLCVKNRAASVWNRTTQTATIHYNSDHSGPRQAIAPGALVNLDATLKNQNASHSLSGTSTPARTKMSFSLYALAGGRVTALFDGYRSTKGKHEGIDIARGAGSPVRALVDGQVINVKPAATGGVSLIAVYNPALAKTVIYLHTAPLRTLAVGQQVRRGQQIATEAARGAGSAVHTHVEMRLGREMYAAYSVDDPKLDNPNPATFWAQQGYLIQ